MDLFGVRPLRAGLMGPPEVNPYRNHKSQPKNAEPSESHAGDGHSSAPQAKRLTANLPKRDVAKNQGRD